MKRVMMQSLFGLLAIGNVLNLEDQIGCPGMRILSQRSAPESPNLPSRFVKIPFLHLTGANFAPEQVFEVSQGRTEVTRVKDIQVVNRHQFLLGIPEKFA